MTMFEPNQQPKHLRLLLIILAVVVLGALIYYFWPLLRGTSPDLFRGEAAGGVTLTLVPNKTTYALNETVTINVMMDTGTNQVAAAELHLAYPAALLEGITIQHAAAMATVLVPGAVSPSAASITLGSGTSPVSPGSGIHIATLTLRALSNGSATITIDPTSQIAALDSADNVLETRNPATITIASPSPSPTPSPVATPSPTPSPSPSPSPVTHQVIINNFVFIPSALSVKKGDTVIFVNQDTVPHTVTAAGTFDSGTIAPGQSFTLSTAALALGTHAYVCSFHPNMQGTLTVTAVTASVPPPTPSPTPSPSPSPTVVVIVPSPSPTPSSGGGGPTPPPLSCSPSSQTRMVNEAVTVSASGGLGAYAWSMPGGSPSSATGATVGPTFAVAGTYNVSVSAGSQSQSCTVLVQAPVSQTVLTCSPASVNAVIGQPIDLNASGPAGSVTWTVPGQAPLTTSQRTLTISFDTPGLHIVTLSNTSQSAQCRVTLAALGQPSPSSPPQVTGPGLVVGTTVRNVTSNSSEADVVNAAPGDVVEFIVRATNNGTVTARNVRFANALPAGLSLVNGSVTVNGVARSDSFVTQNSLVGDVTPGQTTTVRFRATTAPADAWHVGTTALTTSTTAASDNVSSRTDTAFVSVVLGSDASGIPPLLNVRKLGRNVTRGQFSEGTVVRAFGGDTIEFTLRITSQSSVPVSNLVIRDILPAVLNYVPGTSKLNGSTVSDAVPAVGGLLIPVIQPGQEMVLRLNARVRQPAAPQSVLNTLRVTSASSGEIVAQFPVVIEVPSLTAIGDVQTGPGESILWAFVISAIVTLLYVGYTHTNLFRRRELETLIQRGREDSNFRK